MSSGRVTATDTDEFFLRIQYAREDVAALDALVLDFGQDAVQTTIATPINPTAPYSLLIRSTKTVPTRIRSRAGTIVNETRVILDNLASALAARNGYTGSSTVYFPISADKKTFESDGKGKMRRLSQADQNAISNLKPYAGGNDWLCALHRVDVQRKHLKLAQKLLHVGGFKCVFSEAPFPNAIIGPDWSGSIKRCEMRYGDHFMEFTQPSSLTDDFQAVVKYSFPKMSFSDFRITLPFEEPDFIKDKQLCPCLYKFLDVVEDIVKIFS